MKIAYILEAQKNPLYNGSFKSGKSYLTFGQHSFILDLFLSLKYVYHIDIHFYSDEPIDFPLTDYLNNIGIECLHFKPNLIIKADIIILDIVTNTLLKSKFNLIGYKIGIIHNYLSKYPITFYNLSDSIICMTPLAINRQREYYYSEKFKLCYQGVFCERFSWTPHHYTGRIKNVLFYSRMDKYKGDAYESLMLKFLSLGISVSILGAGEKFDEYKAKYNGKFNFIDHKSCIEIPTVLKDYDLIVSNGRGVMEGLSSNKPVIAVGIRYCGLITRNNIIKYRDCNYTGGYMPDKVLDIDNDLFNILQCYKSDPLYFRKMALDYANVNDFSISIIKLLQ